MNGYIPVKIEYDEQKDKFYISSEEKVLKTFFGEWAFMEYLRQLNFPEERVEEITNRAILDGEVII